MGRIMLIDDHAVMGGIFTALLTAMGCSPSKFDFCQDVDAAIVLLKQHHSYAVIFLDHIVPPAYHFRESLSLMDGLHPDAPIVLLTGQIPTDFGSNDIDARICHCIAKDELSASGLHSLLTSLQVPMVS